ncbi:hypothetical protein CRG98_029693 [Punica granatum]|uniref:Uncharacterized protein n=1 Tax=Punica granatum TaxID=22663 RepID=A0A2I0J0Y4_PUNGR|nr:hypothetical protein CRG98_029693 [Punica granatum]
MDVSVCKKIFEMGHGGKRRAPWSRRPWGIAAAWAVEAVAWVGPPGAPLEKTFVRVWGTPRPKQDTSEMRPDASLVTLAPGGIFRVPYWAPFKASVIR